MGKGKNIPTLAREKICLDVIDKKLTRYGINSMSIGQKNQVGIGIVPLRINDQFSDKNRI